LGEGIGEWSGYALGRGAGELVMQSRWYPWFDARMDRFGWLLVFAVSAIPNPVVKLVTTAAGASEMPAWQFGLACVTGKTLKMIVVAYLGALGIALIAPPI
jgi:membrane protein YqaA with SNARE-associated domain